MSYTAPEFGDGYVYQPYSIAIGVIMSLIPCVPVVIVLVKEIINAEGSLLQVSTMSKVILTINDFYMTIVKYFP